jgi:hypothetical protein
MLIVRYNINIRRFSDTNITCVYVHIMLGVKSRYELGGKLSLRQKVVTV